MPLLNLPPDTAAFCSRVLKVAQSAQRDHVDRERQRFEHLVLGRPRPKPEPAAAPKRKRGSRRVAVRGAAGEPAVLAPGVEERVALRERWSHKREGTPETHDHAENARARPGSIARLYASAAIDDDQLAAAHEIVEAYRAITACVAIRTASLEARVDGGAHGRAETQALAAIRADFAYDWWRSAIGSSVEALLGVIVHDVGLTIVARRHGMSMPRARRMLTEALDLWWVGRGRTRRAAIAALGEG
jgi:hypothetical protein